MNPLRKNVAQVGIQITTSDIRGVKVALKKTFWEVLSAVSVPRFRLLDDIIQLKERLDYRNEPTILAITEDSTVHRQMVLNRHLNDSLMKIYLKNYSMKLFGYAYENISIDYRITHRNGQRFFYRMVSARKKYIDFLTRISIKQGFKLRAIDVDAWAAHRLLTSLYNVDGNVGILLKSSGESKLIICDNRQIIQIHKYSLSENSFKFLGDFNDSQPPLSKVYSFDDPLVDDEDFLRLNTDLNTVPVIFEPRLKFYHLNSKHLISLGSALWGKT